MLVHKRISPRFIKWSHYRSTDSNNPDILELKVIDTATFDTHWTVNAPVCIWEGRSWREAILQLRQHASRNIQLLKLWHNHTKTGKLQASREFQLKTWLGVSRNGRDIRRFRMVF